SFVFTSESVTEGHPDKICDQISDAVLDAVYAQDPEGRVACEAMITTGVVFVAGEITARCHYNPPQIVRETIRRVGYDRPEHGFDCNTCAVITSINEQSPDISQGVTEGRGLHPEMGAGDQGMMFGFACRETEELMPLPITLAHKIVRRLAEVRKSGICPFLRPDGKSQVSVRYRDGRPAHVERVVLSAQHSEDVRQEQIQESLVENVVLAVIPEELRSEAETVHYINPTGRFVRGGPTADTGLTGRKIIVDTYGGYSRHGGGSFSGKDPTKVDRSASYMARYIAKNIVAAGLAERCEVQLAYAIGVADPVSVLVHDFGTGQVDSERLARAIREVFPLKPKGILDALRLRRPIYQATAAYGHFGRPEPEFTWERTDRVDDLRSATGS
ncbi:MAG: methionine adenosyltransferase, partial [Nitrospinota bacterium]